MATYDEIGSFIINNKEIDDEINAILCNSCYGKEKYACAGCMKELAMIDLIINLNK